MSRIARDPSSVLRTLDKIIFDPLVVSAPTCLKRCSSALGKGMTRVGTVFRKEGKNILLVVEMEGENAVVKDEVDLSTVNVQSLVDNVSQTDIFSNVDSFTQALRLDLTASGIKPDEYTIRLQDSGTQFTTHLKDGQVISAAFSFVKPTYFDLCCRLDDQHLVYYSNVRAGPLSHSGDLMRSGRLLHTLSYSSQSTDNNDGQVIVPFITGYRNTPLKAFEQHRPVVVIMDHQSKEMIVVRVPLDAATVGEHTLCAPIVGTLCKNADGSGSIHWKVLLTACVGSGAVPNLSTESYKSLERTRAAAPTIEEIRAMNQKAKEPTTAFGPSSDTRIKVVADTKSNNNDDGHTTTEADGEPVPQTAIVSHTTDIDIDDVLSALFKKADVSLSSSSENFDHRIMFGTSVLVCTPDGKVDNNYHPEDTPIPTSDVILPCLLPVALEGGPILAGGTVTEVLEENILSKLYSRCGTIITIVSDKMTDSARESNPHMRLNGIFIVVCNQKTSWASCDNPEEEEKEHREMLLSLNINAATALAGPKSLLLAYLPQSGSLYTLDGVGIPGLIQSPVEPLKNCTDEFCSNLKSYLDSVRVPPTTSSSNQVLVDIRTAKVDFMSEDHDINTFKDLLIQLPVSDLVDNKSDVMDSLAQLRRLYDDAELQKFAASVITPLQQRMCPPKFKLTEDEAADLDELFAGQATKTDTYKEARAEATKNKKLLRWLVDALGSLVSVRRSGTMGFNIQKLAKQQKVSENVKAALALTTDSFTDLIDEYCPETGVVLTPISRSVLKKSLELVGSGKFLSELQDFCLPANGDGHPLAVFDSAQLLTLSQLTKSWSKHPLSLPPGKVSLGFPSCGGDKKKTSDWSSMAFPLIDRFADMQDPFVANWFTYADWQPIAMMRVVARNTLANCSVARVVDGKIEPVSKHLGYLLICLHLATIQKVSQLQDENDKSVNCQSIQRSLYGSLMCTMSSGSGEPLCNGFNLFGKDKVPTIPKEHEWHVYSQIAAYFKYTGWPVRQLQYNIAWLLIHWLNVKLITEVTNAVRGKVKGKVAEKTKGRIALVTSKKQSPINNITVVVIGEDDAYKSDFCTSKFNDGSTSTESARRGAAYFDPEGRVTYLLGPNFKQVRNNRTILSYADIVFVLSKDGSIPQDTVHELDCLGLLSNVVVVSKTTITSSHRIVSDDTPLSELSKIAKEQRASSDEDMSNEEPTFLGQVFRIFPKAAGNPVFAMKVVGGELATNVEVTFLQTTNKEPVTGTIVSARSYPTGEALPEGTRTVAGDFVSCEIQLKDPDCQPVVTGSFVTLAATPSSTTDLIQVSATKVGGKRWLGKGAHIIAVVGGIAAEMVIEDVFEGKRGDRVLNLSSPLEGITLAIGSSANCGIASKMRVYSSSNKLVMIATVLGTPSDAKSELVSATAAEGSVSHAKLTLPPSYSNCVLGQIVNSLVLHPKMLSYTKKGVLTKEKAAAVSESLLVTKPPTLQAITTLSACAFDIQQSEVAKKLLTFVDQLLEFGTAEDAEHKILTELF
eukprot:TRINITY_DN435_c0_g1_i7.p1 TRINITY_DN435_c0_g1~~TRINITY_DN435_c0_g1_i7.p1  ORF type:complete len:1546 (+),score=405.34 TRINITY_DN435_c0_g1_i7:79-4638(+)